MLRGIRTASANWLGRIVMGVVLGLIAISFAIWGIGDIFRGFGRSQPGADRRHRDLDRAVPAALQRAAAAARPSARPPDHARIRRAQMGLDQQLVGQLIGEATLDERVKALRLGISDAEMARRITTNPDLLGPDRPIRPHALRDDAAQQPDHRAALRRRTAPPDACGGNWPAPSSTERSCRRPRWKPPSAIRTSSAPIEYVLLDRAQAGEIPEPTPEAAREIFRGAQGAVPRARVSQDRRPAAVARRAGDVDRDLRRRRARRPTKSAARAISRPSAGRCSRSSSTIRRRRRRRPTASPRAKSFLDIAKERKLTEKEIDLGTLTQGRDDRPGGRRRRLRAQGERGQRAGQGTLRHRAGARAEDRAGAGPAVRGGRATSSGASSRTSAPGPRSCRSTTRSRTSARSAGRWRRPPPI